ncbi:MAG: Rrf2 family transcriptional regulator [Limnohabitans sp.]|jgi:Rrf2 family iron-sulfur cluster assembly transcriptional regulator|nr:Rrf2 family transcriptional regulator [Limnohabitans sp.]MBP6245131.1 Rrf2 family transcriptional regulator [Limnohabitans sp.]
MRMSKRSQLAVTALVEVALREGEGPVSLVAIQSRHNITKTRLEQIFSKLRQSHLVDSTIGPGGGYSLAMEAEQISVADIVLAMEPSDTFLQVGEAASVSDRLWLQLNQKMMQDLQSISLKQLVNAQSLEDAKQKQA